IGAGFPAAVCAVAPAVVPQPTRSAGPQRWQCDHFQATLLDNYTSSANMPRDTTPLYERIQEMLRTQIASGRLAAGERLPSETELAESFATTRMTVRQALAKLTFEGLI